jgi:hypothetical protein
MFIAMAPILVPVAIWMYTLVFAFSSLWFAHYTLAALEQLRKKNVANPHVSSALPAIEMVANGSVPKISDGRSGTPASSAPPGSPMPPPISPPTPPSF